MPLANIHLAIDAGSVGAEDALRFGLINDVHDDVLGAALELANTIAGGPSQAMGAAKALVDVSGRATLVDGIVREREAIAELFDSADRVEGMTAFTQKRPPRFAGR